MKNKQLAITLICFALLSGIFLVNAKALSWPTLPPDPVTMNIVLVESADEWHFITTLSNVPVGYDVSNGVYQGWCVDRRSMIDPVLEVYLYSSYDLPAIPELHMQEWDLINYVLNHKIPEATTRDIQQAIWNFTKLGYQEAATRPLAIAMVNDAVANGEGFVPGPGQVMAIICYPILPCEQITIIELPRPPEERYPKQFTSSYGFCGFAAPEITDDGLNTTVVGLHSGPRISWNVTYYFANTEEFLGSEFDGEAHYFCMWDKWGGNLMALDSTPVAFNELTNIVTLADGTTFEINYAGYAAYIGNGLPFTDSRGRSAMITLHTGDLQQGTNPGKGKGTTKDGSSYDVDVVWNIGYLEPGQSASLTIVIAPGKNPAGKLQFSSPGFNWINTGPRTRVYGDADFTDFLYAIDQTIQLGVMVER